MTHAGRDPQVDLVRRYARILRSAPAEALRAWEADPPTKASEPPATTAVFDRRRDAAGRVTERRSASAPA
ncbi:MAG TPA: hypothetical protein VNT03_10485 [Baekduia sp.]|nr:hypothetical protein [Baekduia sp.]